MNVLWFTLEGTNFITLSAILTAQNMPFKFERVVNKNVK